VREVFADAGYWIAMYNPHDSLHQKAHDVTAQLGPVRIVTSEMVLVEFLNYASKRGYQVRHMAAKAADTMRIDPSLYIAPQTSQQFQAAILRYSSRLDQRWSVTDCASFLIMEERGITDALAHDRDFQQAGFRSLLR